MLLLKQHTGLSLRGNFLLLFYRSIIYVKNVSFSLLTTIDIWLYINTQELTAGCQVSHSMCRLKRLSELTNFKRCILGLVLI